MRYVRIENKEQVEAVALLELRTMNLWHNGRGRKTDKGMGKVNNYLKLNDKYLKEGDVLLQKGDYVQASEKFWRAAAEAVKAIAASKGVDIRSHGELCRFVTWLGKETDDIEILRYFGLALALHQNFYENWLTPEMVADYADAVKSLVEKLKTLAR